MTHRLPRIARSFISPKKHEQNVKTVAQPSFFLKIAEMADGQDDKVKRELDGLSIQVTAALEDILKMAERSMDEANA